jgi:hypothetical protein
MAPLDSLYRKWVYRLIRVITLNNKTAQIPTGNDTWLKLGNEALQKVECFTYLGANITQRPTANDEVNNRIDKANKSFLCLCKIWKDKMIDKSVKLHVYKVTVRAVLLYALETLPLYEKPKTRSRLLEDLDVFDRKCLRRIMGIYWHMHVSNEELYKRVGCVPINTFVQKNRLRWVGHVYECRWTGCHAAPSIYNNCHDDQQNLSHKHGVQLSIMKHSKFV